MTDYEQARTHAAPASTTHRTPLQDMSFWQARQRRLQQSSSVAASPSLAPTRPAEHPRSPLQDISHPPNAPTSACDKESLDTYKRLVDLASLRQDVAAALAACHDAATVLDQEHHEQQQQAMQRLATQHATAAQELGARQAQLQGLLGEVDGLASDYGSALKTRSAVQAPLHARHTRLHQRAAQYVAAAAQPVRVQWADAAATEQRARQAAWAAVQEEVATLRATVQQQATALQEASAARQSLQQQADGRAAALSTAQSQLSAAQQQLADTRQQLAEAQRSAREALAEAEARHSRELAQRDSLHAPLLAHLQEWVARSPQQRMSISNAAQLPTLRPMPQQEGGFVTGAALAAAARQEADAEEAARQSFARAAAAAPLGKAIPKEAPAGQVPAAPLGTSNHTTSLQRTPARRGAGPSLLSPSPGLLPRPQQPRASPARRAVGGSRGAASHAEHAPRVSPLEALASVMLDTSEQQAAAQQRRQEGSSTAGPLEKEPSSAERRAAWLAKQQARLRAKAAALATEQQHPHEERQPVARRLAPEAAQQGPRCIKCGVTQGQAAHPRYAACRFHPALLEDPGALKFTPSWYSCRRAAHTAKQPGCFVRPHGHTFVESE